jgi:hypothetical protein
MDLLFAFLAGLGPGFRRTIGPPPPHPMTLATRLAGGLVLIVAVPGVALVVGGIKFLGGGNDMLAPFIGMVGLVALGGGLVIVAWAVALAVGLWSRNPGARDSGIVVGVVMGFVGPMVGLIVGGAWGTTIAILLLGYGAILGWLLLGPGGRADFPTPLQWTARGR